MDAVLEPMAGAEAGAETGAVAGAGAEAATPPLWVYCGNSGTRIITFWHQNQ
jgi:hypothetical protein